MTETRRSRLARLLLICLLPLSAVALPLLKSRDRLKSLSCAGLKDTKWISKSTTSTPRSTSIQNHAGRFHRSSLISLFASNRDNNLPEPTTRMTRNIFFVAIGTFLVSSSILLELYSRIGALFINDENDEKPLPPIAQDQKHATIIFHGSGGQDQYTDALMERLRTNNPSQYIEIVEWSKYSTNILQASYNGERIGKLVVKELLSNVDNLRNLKTIHLIGISVGSFCADAAARELKKLLDASSSSQQRPFVQLTLLDPFTQRGIFGLGYGNKVFGTAADYTQQFLNTDDPVPSTNAPLENAVCYDITNLRPEEVFGHDWPVAFYGRSEECGKVMISKARQSQEGTVLKL